MESCYDHGPDICNYVGEHCSIGEIVGYRFVATKYDNAVFRVLSGCVLSFGAYRVLLRAVLRAKGHTVLFLPLHLWSLGLLHVGYG